jgi:hypothetical protein
MKQSIDILPHVTWVFLAVFGLGWHWLDKRSQMYGNLSIIAPAIMKCCHILFCMNEKCLNDEYFDIIACMCLIEDISIIICIYFESKKKFE